MTKKPSERWIRLRRAELLSNRTQAEKEAYKILISFGLHVLQQYPIWTGRRIFFADLFLPQYRAILELDGGYHQTCKQKRLDRNRSASLRRLGFHVVRLPNIKSYSPKAIRSKLSSLK